ncbi:unnamed protein product [Polarella glacialis]|uniref:Uncharacterized protein n=1 Tax=Polarella glacialis TaxID=89957 RepID=A0A813LVZ8_POLGL|nr:unnamed protein product [Polarella glacialis]
MASKRPFVFRRNSSRSTPTPFRDLASSFATRREIFRSFLSLQQGWAQQLLKHVQTLFVLLVLLLLLLLLLLLWLLLLWLWLLLKHVQTLFLLTQVTSNHSLKHVQTLFFA